MNFLTQLAQPLPAYNDYSSTQSTYIMSSDPFYIFVPILLYIVIVIALSIFSVYMLSRIFEKAGVEKWKAWVPIYNSWIMLQIGGQNGIWAVLMMVPLLNIVALVYYVIAMYNIGLKLGKTGSFILLAIFVPIVWMAWLAFDSSTWEGSDKAQNPTIPTFTPPTTSNQF